MDYLPEAKSARLLAIYARLLSGEALNRVALAGEYGVTVRSVQRDIESLRCFLAEQHLSQDVIYDRRERAYRLVNSVPKGLSNSEILAVCKILLESRSMIPTWRERDYTAVPAGTPYQWQGIVYKLVQAHDATGNPGWTPDAAPALWSAVSRPGETGSADDPITAVRGMEYVYGRYYLDPEDGAVYLCTRAGEAEGGAVILQYLPHELVGQYFAEG